MWEMCFQCIVDYRPTYCLYFLMYCTSWRHISGATLSMPIRKISVELIDEICGSFRSLSVLNLARNEITTIENLERLRPSLTKLDLSDNSIATIDNLERLTALVYLDLSSNMIGSLTGLERLAALETLHVADNRLESVGALRSLSYLRGLHTITLQGNPLTRAMGYQAQVAERLPALRILDGTPIPAAPIDATPLDALPPPPTATEPRPQLLPPSLPQPPPGAAHAPQPTWSTPTPLPPAPPTANTSPRATARVASDTVARAAASDSSVATPTTMVAADAERFAANAERLERLERDLAMAELRLAEERERCTATVEAERHRWAAELHAKDEDLAR